MDMRCVQKSRAAGGQLFRWSASWSCIV